MGCSTRVSFITEILSKFRQLDYADKLVAIQLMQHIINQDLEKMKNHIADQDHTPDIEDIPVS